MTTAQIARAMMHVMAAFTHSERASPRTRAMVLAAAAKLRARIAIEDARGYA